MSARTTVVWGLRAAAAALFAAQLVVACRGFVGPDFEPARATAPEAAGANVLVVLLDDVGTDKISGYGEHPDAVPTPEIDAFGARGVRFTNAYAFPTCGPSRVALLTGRYGRRAGMTDNLRVHAGQDPLPDGVAMIPEMLRQSEAGYTSAGVGKWHLSEHKEEDVRQPLDQGFDDYSGVLGNLVLREDYTHYTWREADGRVEERTTYLTVAEVDRALELVRTLPEPWFVYVSLHAPHAPFDPPASSGLGPDATERERYDATLAAADHELGRLFDAVDLEDTLVMVLGDNGTPGEAVARPWKRKQAKNTLFEGGVNVPWLVAGPGIAPGRVEEELVHIVDIFATVADSAGLDPDRDGLPSDGRSLWPLLLGLEHDARDHVYLERSASRRADVVRMVRGPRYKVVRDGNGATALHDLHGRIDDGPTLTAAERTPEAEAAYQRLSATLDRVDADIELDEPRSGGCAD